MGFASYLHKHSLFKPFIIEEPKPGTSLIVVIPSYNEPDLLTSLMSLYNADRPVFPVEVIIVVNSPEGACIGSLNQNRKTILQVQEWCRNKLSDTFTVHVIDVPAFPRRHAGAGFARKCGMDEAVHRFNMLNNEKGIIASFDADSICDSNYFTELEKCFSYPGRRGCTIYFEHPLSDKDQSPLISRAIIHYELYLRYYVQAMRMADYPWSFHTIGSCFAVNAKVYASQGGMNRKKAGEDFYFLHKIFPLGNFIELNSTRVVPSSRISDRVPFGTGAAIKRFASDSQSAIKAYPLESFDSLAQFLAKVPEFFRADEKEIEKILKLLPPCIRGYLLRIEFLNAVRQMNMNSVRFPAFRKRFFLWFNAIRTLRYFNYARENYREDQSVIMTAVDLLERCGIPYKPEGKSLLFTYRELQRNTIWEC